AAAGPFTSPPAGRPVARAWHSVSLATAWARSPPGFARAVAWASSLAMAAAFGPLAARTPLGAGAHSARFFFHGPARSPPAGRPVARAWHSVSLATAWARSPLGFARAVAWASSLAMAAAFGPLAARAALSAGVYSARFFFHCAARSPPAGRPVARAWHSVSLATAWARSPPGFDSVAASGSLPAAAAALPPLAIAARIA